MTKTTHDAALVKGLSILLADTYLLKLKTHGYHWNVKGHDFFSLHQAFMMQYEEMEQAIDEIAERIRALNADAPASYLDYQKLSLIKEIHMPKNAQEMVDDLIKAHEILIKQVKELSSLASQAQDFVTQALADERTKIHEKTLWMLKSFAQ